MPKFQTWDHENVYNLCGVGKCIETHAKIKYNPNDILKWEYKWFTKNIYIYIKRIKKNMVGKFIFARCQVNLGIKVTWRERKKERRMSTPLIRFFYLKYYCNGGQNYSIQIRSLGRFGSSPNLIFLKI